MKRFILPIAVAFSTSIAFANEPSYSLSLGQKTMHFDLQGYSYDGIELYKVKASATAIYVSLSLQKNQHFSYAFELGSFVRGHGAGQTNRTGNDQGPVREDLDVEIEPSTYFNGYAQYTFRPGKIVKPFALGGLTFVATDKTSHSTKSSNGRSSNASFAESADSLGLMAGLGLDISLYQNLSFTFDYRVLQDVADQPTVEFNGSFKYQF